VVFFKGCRLRCRFCHSPQSQDPRPEITFYPGRCVGCGRCQRACPQQAASLGRRQRVDRRRCRRCGACARVCPGGALQRLGRRWEPAELAELLLRDRAYHHHSGGGVTLSGGECLLFPGYLQALLDALRRARGGTAAHVLVQTGGHFPWGAARAVLRRVDGVQFDLKLADAGAHRRHTGRTNRLVLDNLRRTVRSGVPVEARVPVIPGVTDDPDNLRALTALARDAGVVRLTLLPYNPAGLDAYPPLGRPAPALPRAFLSPARWEELNALVSAWLGGRAEPARHVPGAAHEDEDVDQPGDEKPRAEKGDQAVPL
jgi:pyruvate formate lyase activating enzyme